MKPQHLSDEAVAAFADGVLSGHARDRACRHLNSCPECRRAVTEQREAAVALRAAPAPELPTNLLDRLRSVPLTTPLPPPPPTAIAPDGSEVFSAFAPMAAFAPDSGSRKHRGRTYLTAAVLVGVTGALVAGGVAAGTDDGTSPNMRTVNHLRSGGTSLPPGGGAPMHVFHGGNRP